MVEDHRRISAPKGVRLQTTAGGGIKASLQYTTRSSEMLSFVVGAGIILGAIALFVGGKISFEVFLAGVLLAGFSIGAIARKRMCVAIDDKFIYLDDKQYDREHWGGFDLGHSETVVRSRRSSDNSFQTSTHTKHRMGFLYGNQPHELNRWFHQKNIGQIVDWLNAQTR